MYVIIFYCGNLYAARALVSDSSVNILYNAHSASLARIVYSNYFGTLAVDLAAELELDDAESKSLAVRSTTGASTENGAYYLGAPFRILCLGAGYFSQTTHDQSIARAPNLSSSGKNYTNQLLPPRTACCKVS